MLHSKHIQLFLRERKKNTKENTYLLRSYRTKHKHTRSHKHWHAHIPVTTSCSEIRATEALPWALAQLRGLALYDSLDFDHVQLTSLKLNTDVSLKILYFKSKEIFGLPRKQGDWELPASLSTRGQLGERADQRPLQRNVQSVHSVAHKPWHSPQSTLQQAGRTPSVSLLGPCKLSLVISRRIPSNLHSPCCLSPHSCIRHPSHTLPASLLQSLSSCALTFTLLHPGFPKLDVFA